MQRSARTRLSSGLHWSCTDWKRSVCVEIDGCVCVVVRFATVARTRQGTLKVHGFLEVERVARQEVQPETCADQCGSRKTHFDDDGSLRATCGACCRVSQLKLVQFVADFSSVKDEPREQDELRGSGQEENHPRSDAGFLELVCEKHGFGARVKNLRRLHLFRSK
jgi:hypothetical protein